MKLLSMTDYVLELKSNEPDIKNFSGFTILANYEKECYSKIIRYANFLKQPLELWMFVPCELVDGVWKHLEEPKRWKDYLDYPDSFDGNKEWNELYVYQQAKERVLFEGFEVTYKSDVSICVENENFDIRFKKDGAIDSFRFRIIEHLVCRNPTLSQTAINQLK